ncbi:rho GTPase-activating protein 190 [Trichonephila clavipes]|nr:rho GTPase-activating protein 190 [Trichonephila clavipes]
MARKSETQRTFNIAVVGLSGTEKEKGSTGVGKSCLCNRFIRSLADDYYTDHISVLSQTDFSGRVVNNDHFLYWGEVSKLSEDGVDFNFHVIEQTEFIDDSSFQPFKSGKTDPYYKRSSATKLTSAEKLMYICKNQLGIEKEYEQKLLPDGKINIDGFVCVFDVSEVQGRSIEKQVEFTALILNNLMKTKKPIVLATTKNDEAKEMYVKEAERLVNRKEFKNNIPIVETSAHENVNVDLTFIIVAQMIDRTKGKAKLVPFFESARSRKEVLDFCTEAYQSLIRAQVTDYRALWSSVSKKFAQNQDFIHYCELFGHDAAQKMFRRHVKKLKEEYIGRKMQMYIRILPEVLGELLPDLASIGDGEWESVRVKLQQHPDFSQYFLESPDEQPWQESDLVDSNETRIPLDILDSSEAEACFEEHKAALEAEERRKEMRQQFKELLEETGYVTPGKPLSEVQVLFMGRECYESLSEPDLLEIYDEHQREITEKAKQNFQELLLENAEIFYHFTSIGPGSVITQEDINKITEKLQEDLRYKTLDRLDQDRMLMLLRHLGFVHGPIREHCPASLKCMDTLVEKTIAQKAHRPFSWQRNSHWLLENNQLNLVLLGSGGLADELANIIKAQCTDDMFEVDKVQYSLDFRIIEGDVGLPQNSFRTSDFLPHEARKLIAAQPSQTYAQAAKSLTVSDSTQTGENIRKIVCAPLKLLQPASSLSRRNVSIPSFHIVFFHSSTPITFQLLQYQKIPILLADQAIVKKSRKRLLPKYNETGTPFLQISKSNISTKFAAIAVKKFAAQKLSLIPHRKKCPKTICKDIEIKMTPRKLKKSTSVQDTSDEEDMFEEEEMNYHILTLSRNGKKPFTISIVGLGGGNPHQDLFVFYF